MRIKRAPRLAWLGWLAGFTLGEGCASEVRPNAPPVPAASAASGGTATSTTAPSIAASAPIAHRAPTKRRLHDDLFVDDYVWLQNKNTPEVDSYLRAENEYTSRIMQPLEGFEQSIYQELIGHLQETDNTVPVRHHGWWYYSRTEAGKEYPIYCRKRGEKAPEEIILDLNLVAGTQKFVGLGTHVVSDDNRWWAYGLDETGFRQYRLHFMDLKTHRPTAEVIERVDGVAWGLDNRTVWYVVEDDAKRAYRAYRHTVGSDPREDVLVYEERDERFELLIDRTLDQRFVVLTSESKLTTEVRVLDLRHSTTPPQIIEPRRPSLKYYVDHAGERFLITANDKGHNFRIVAVKARTPGQANWQQLRAHDENVTIESAQAIGGYLVLSLRKGGLPRIEVLDLKSGKIHRIEVPEPAYELQLDQNEEYATPTIRYAYQSLVTPLSIYEYDLAKHESRLLKRRTVPGGFDPEAYTLERVSIPARDGTAIPVSMVAKKGLSRDGPAPLLLYSYGAYGWALPVGFDASLLPLLDRGVIYAVAHVRGGGELGKGWHEQGRMLTKKKTFTDFIDAAEWLISSKYTAPDRLVIHGRSAGGLLIGAVVNARPELFKAAVLDMPFVDVVNTMNRPELPLTVGEYEEWGNPANPDEYRYLRSYSPYDNLSAQSYPSILVRSSYNDSQVMYFEPAKYVARLRALKTDAHPLLFKINLEAAGHGGKSGRYESIRDTAFLESFLLWQLDLAGPGFVP